MEVMTTTRSQRVLVALVVLQALRDHVHFTDAAAGVPHRCVVTEQQVDTGALCFRRLEELAEIQSRGS